MLTIVIATTLLLVVPLRLLILDSFVPFLIPFLIIIHSFPFSEPPITKEIQMLDVENGPSPLFQCEVLGNAPFGVTWLNSIAPVLDKKHKLVFGDSLTHLEIRSFERMDVEEYPYYLHKIGQIPSKSVAKLEG